MNRRQIVNGWVMVRQGMSITGPRIQRFKVFRKMNIMARGAWIGTFDSEDAALAFCDANIGPLT